MDLWSLNNSNQYLELDLARQIQALDTDMDLAEPADAKSFLADLLSSAGCKLKQFESGADRHQCFFEFAGSQFLLQLELLSLSCWVETVHGSASLSDLLKPLNGVS